MNVRMPPLPRRVALTETDRDLRRRYFENGVDEFRRLLESEFQRTHPGGYYRNATPPSGHDFRPKVNVGVPLEEIASQFTAARGPRVIVIRK